VQITDRAYLTSTCENRTGVVNSEPLYPTIPHGAVEWGVKERTDSHARPRAHSIQLLVECGGV
jgi:hypothetical protein